MGHDGHKLNQLLQELDELEAQLNAFNAGDIFDEEPTVSLEWEMEP